MLKVMRALQETTVLFQAESVMCVGRAGGGAEILMTPLSSDNTFFSPVCFQYLKETVLKARTHVNS